MKMRNQPPVDLQRGEAIIDEYGNLITSGSTLKKATGTKKNYGLLKLKLKHNMSKEDLQQIPKIIRKNKPIEISEFGQKIYRIPNPKGNDIILALSPQGNKYVVVSMYELDK